MTKITIFSGFLGAGKTTLIKKLIPTAYKGEKLVLIENEFGEIGIDGGFMKDAGIEVTEMNSGCICCSLVGDFGAALQKVLDEYHPDRILIEPSGVGKLSDVIRAVQALHADVELAGFVTVADASKCRIYMKNFGEFYNNQIEHASAIILSRTQNLPEDKLAAAVALLRGHNEKAPIVTTPWDALTGAQLLDAMDSEQATPSLSQAQRLKKYSQEGHLTLDMMRVIMGEEKKSDLDKITFTSDTLRKYFPRSYTPARMQETIIKLLEQWQRKRQRDQER